MKSLFLTLMAVGTLFVSGCRTVTPQTSSKEGSAKAASSDEKQLSAAELEKRAEAFAHFAAGNSHQLNDQPDLALAEFHKSALADPSNESIALDLARRFLQKKQPEKAIELLLNTSKLPQASGNVFSWLARAYVATGETNLALNAGKTAIKKSPTLISGYGTLTDIFLKTGQPAEALKILNSASKATNSDALFLIHLGDFYGDVAHAQSKESEPAKQRGLEVLKRAADLKPSNPNLRQKLADNFSELGDSTKAAEIYLQLLGEFHDLPLMRDAMREKLANIYLRGSDKSKAAEQLEAIVRDSPTRYPQAWYYLGTFAYDAKDYAKATDYFQRAIVTNPDMERAYLELAGLQIDIDQAGEALKTLEKARAKFPNNFTVEFFSGIAYSRLKSYSEAVKHFVAAEIIGKASDPKKLTPQFYFQLGAACERNHDYEQSEKYFEKCLELSPDFADALNYLGFMWADRGVKLEKARVLIEKAVKLEPENAAYIDSLGWVLFKLNENEAALQHLLKAAQLSAEPDAVVYDHIGDVYQAMKQTRKAREAWQKSLSFEPNADVEKKLRANSSAP
jgi:tetratricopeptide (TPR) repeat protein